MTRVLNKLEGPFPQMASSECGKILWIDAAFIAYFIYFLWVLSRWIWIWGECHNFLVSTYLLNYKNRRILSVLSFPVFGKAWFMLGVFVANGTTEESVQGAGKSNWGFRDTGRTQRCGAEGIVGKVCSLVALSNNTLTTSCFFSGQL